MASGVVYQKRKVMERCGAVKMKQIVYECHQNENSLTYVNCAILNQ